MALRHLIWETGEPKTDETGELLVDAHEDDKGEDIDLDADVCGATIYCLIFDLMELTSGIITPNVGLG